MTGHSTGHSQTQLESYRAGWLAAADELAEPYPVDIFTPMDEDEVKAAVDAMNNAVPNASERLHAAWARHWSTMLRNDVNCGD